MAGYRFCASLNGQGIYSAQPFDDRITRQTFQITAGFRKISRIPMGTTYFDLKKFLQLFHSNGTLTFLGHDLKQPKIYLVVFGCFQSCFATICKYQCNISYYLLKEHQTHIQYPRYEEHTCIFSIVILQRIKIYSNQKYLSVGETHLLTSDVLYTPLVKVFCHSS